MPAFSLLIKLCATLAAVVLVGVGGYRVAQDYSLAVLQARIDENLGSGDYLAALAAYNDVKARGDEATESELGEKAAAAARLLVAEENFKKAKAAAGVKDWESARALLRGSEAVTNPAFASYEEAKRLYGEAEAFAAREAHKTATAINALEEKTKVEQEKRRVLEERTTKLEGTLQKEKAAAASAVAEAARTSEALVAKQKEAAETRVELEKQEKRVKALAEAVEKESRQKFFTELKTYRDMAVKGKEQLDAAVAEISGKRDVTALIYVSQGKILFEEAKTKTADLRANRAPEQFKTRVDDLSKALADFLESAKQLRNAVAYSEEQGSAEFTASLSKGKTSLANAAALLSTVSDFIAANPS